MSLNPLSFLSKALDPISKAIDNLHTSDEERLSIKAELLGVQRCWAKFREDGRLCGQSVKN